MRSQLNNLREVSISNMKVSQGGEENELQRSVPNITELDLSKNLLNSWEEVAKITQQLNYLRILNIR